MGRHCSPAAGGHDGAASGVLGQRWILPGKNSVATLHAGSAPAVDIDSGYAWTRLALSIALGTVGGVGMWSFVVALPAVQAEFGVTRGEISLAFTLTMAGYGLGGILMGRLADRFGVLVPVVTGAVLLGAGYLVSGSAATAWRSSGGMSSRSTPLPLMNRVSSAGPGSSLF